MDDGGRADDIPRFFRMRMFRRCAAVVGKKFLQMPMGCGVSEAKRLGIRLEGMVNLHWEGCFILLKQLGTTLLHQKLKLPPIESMVCAGEVEKKVKDLRLAVMATCTGGKKDAPKRQIRRWRGS